MQHGITRGAWQALAIGLALAAVAPLAPAHDRHRTMPGVEQ
jgi:hypothetical protein